MKKGKAYVLFVLVACVRLGKVREAYILDEGMGATQSPFSSLPFKFVCRILHQVYLRQVLLIQSDPTFLLCGTTSQHRPIHFAANFLEDGTSWS